MDLVLSLPAGLQDFLFVEMLADLAPLLQVRLVSKRHRLEAERVLSRLTRELRSQENYWTREMKELRLVLANELLPPVLSTLGKGLEWSESRVESADCRVIVAGMKLTGLLGKGAGLDYYPLWELRPERLPKALKTLDFFHLSDELVSCISELHVNEKDLKDPLALAVNRFIQSVVELRADPRFQATQKRFLSLESLQTIHARLLRILMRLYLMKTNQFFPSFPLNTLISSAESEAKAIYESARFRHC
jgi:hypothetical protein